MMKSQRIFNVLFWWTVSLVRSKRKNLIISCQSLTSQKRQLSRWIIWCLCGSCCSCCSGCCSSCCSCGCCSWQVIHRKFGNLSSFFIQPYINIFGEIQTLKSDGCKFIAVNVDIARQGDIHHSVNQPASKGRPGG